MHSVTTCFKSLKKVDKEETSHERPHVNNAKGNKTRGKQTEVKHILCVKRRILKKRMANHTTPKHSAVSSDVNGSISKGNNTFLTRFVFESMTVVAPFILSEKILYTDRPQNRIIAKVNLDSTTTASVPNRALKITLKTNVYTEIIKRGVEIIQISPRIDPL